MKDKRDVWMRIPVFIISGAILHVWGCFIFIFALVQLILILLKEKKEREFVNMFVMFSEQLYCFMKYITFLSEEKPFPFAKLKKEKR